MPAPRTRTKAATKPQPEPTMAPVQEPQPDTLTPQPPASAASPYLDGSAELERRHAFRAAWHDCGMPPGDARRAYVDAIEAGLFGPDGLGDVVNAARAIAAARRVDRS